MKNPVKEGTAAPTAIGMSIWTIMTTDFRPVETVVRDKIQPIGPVDSQKICEGQSPAELKASRYLLEDKFELHSRHLGDLTP